jgi:hypothetical protein
METVAPATQQPTITATNPIVATAPPTQLSATGTPEPSPTATIDFPAAEMVNPDPSNFDLVWEEFSEHYRLPRDAVWIRVGGVIVALTPERETLALDLDPHYGFSPISLQVTADGNRIIYSTITRLVIEDLAQDQHWHVRHQREDFWMDYLALSPDGSKVAFLTNPVAGWIDLDTHSLHPFAEAIFSKGGPVQPRYFSAATLFDFDYFPGRSFFPRAWIETGILGFTASHGTDGGRSLLKHADFESRRVETVEPDTSSYISPAPDGQQIFYIDVVPYAYPPFETQFGILNVESGQKRELGAVPDARVQFESWSPNSTAIALLVDEYGTEWGPEWLDIYSVASGWRNRISTASFESFGLLKEAIWRNEYSLLLLFHQPEAMRYVLYQAPAANVAPDNLKLLSKFIDPLDVSGGASDVSIVYVPTP